MPLLVSLLGGVQCVAVACRWDSFRTFYAGGPMITLMTSVCLGLCGLIVAGFRVCRRGGVAPVLLIGMTSWAITFLALRDAANRGVFVDFLDEGVGPYTMLPGKPSGCTMAAIVLIGISGFAWALRQCLVVRLAGSIVGAIGALACIGHAINLPLLYCFVEKTSGGMSLPAAIAFLVLGAAQVKNAGCANVCEH